MATVMLFGTQSKVDFTMGRQPILRIFFVTVLAVDLAGVAAATIDVSSICRS